MKLKFFKFVGLAGLVGLCVGQLHAQETNELESLRREMREMRKHMEALEQKIRRLEENSEAAAAPGTNKTAAPPSSVSNQQTEAEKKKLESQIAAELSAGGAQSSYEIPPSEWSPAQPIRIGRAGAYADIGLVATFAAGGSTATDIEGGTELGGHDPHVRGFTVQGAEMNIQGAVDPFFRGNANIAFILDSGGDTEVELEEAWLETISLPLNLQVRAGQILTEFGRINTQHPHSWAFVDVPLVSGRLLGEDGLRNPGARVSWLAPTPFYSELFFNIQDSQGGTASSFRNEHEGDTFFGRLNGSRGVKTFSDLLLSARYVSSFELTENQTLNVGVSGVFGPNSSGNDTCTQIGGVDLYWKWKSPRAHAGFPFVSWQTEAMLRRYEAKAFNWDLNGDTILDADEQDANGDLIPDLLPRETITDWGFYSQVLWGFKTGWVAGLRGDYVTGETAVYEKLYGSDLSRATRWRVSPNLTWYPSEFSKIRLQYNYDDRDGIGVDHSVWLQFEFLLGAHAAHKF